MRTSTSSRHSPFPFGVVTVAFLGSAAVAFLLSEGGSQQPEAGRPAGASTTSEAETAGARRSPAILRPQAAQALQALAQARALPSAPSLDAVPRTMTDYQKLRFRHRSVDNLHQSLIVRVAAATRQQCASVNESSLEMRAVWKARMQPTGAVLTDPVLTMRDGGPVPDEVRDCLMKVLGPELTLASQAGRPLPSYEGDVELGMNMGTEGNWRPPVTVP
jgi:hypothetical protein